MNRHPVYVTFEYGEQAMKLCLNPSGPEAWVVVALSNLETIAPARRFVTMAEAAEAFRVACRGEG